MRKDICEALQRELELHPNAQRIDEIKLVHQAAFGPAHMIQNEQSSLHRLMDEKAQCLKKEMPQRISADFYRVPLSYMQEEDLTLWNRLFIASANTTKKDVALFEECMLSLLQKNPPNSYESHLLHEGVHHSDVYREQYQPHYRVIRSIYVDYFPLIKKIMEASQKEDSCSIAIDGRCASGKSTLAKALQEIFTCNLFHMDDYFLPIEKRSKQRLSQPGGNVDYERFMKEILLPIKTGRPIVYQPYDCQSQSLLSPITVAQTPLTIIEGSYAHHPYFKDAYDIRICMTCDEKLQKERLQQRSPSLYQRFLDEWIPMEEQYFQAFEIYDKADMVCSSDPK